MKKVYLVIILSITYFSVKSQQVTITLQPGATNGKDAYITNWPTNNWNNSNFGNIGDFVAISWTDGGVPYVGRSLVEFDLSTIPSGATILSAHLSLFNNPTSSQTDGQHKSLSGPNDAWLERIITPWSEMSVSWNNQPSTTFTNAVYLPQSISPNQDYLNINVTNLVIDMVNNPTSSFGFMMKLSTEQQYRSVILTSSDHPDAFKHPKLEITYVTNCVNLNLQPNSADGKDAYITNWSNNNWINTNFGTINDYIAIAWTDGGVPYVGRSLIDFDLSSIPSNAIITNAYLSLYNNPNSSQVNGQHSSLSGSNQSVLKKIVSPWSENSVTWNTQPATSSLNQVTLPQSPGPNDDYININITSLIQDKVSNPSDNFGFMLQLGTESYYRSLIFASSDHVDPLKRPRLAVHYTIPAPSAIITASGSTNLCQGGSVTLNANTGVGLSYQWKLNGNNIPGANSSSYSANVAGNYSVVVSNNCGSRTSNIIAVSVASSPGNVGPISGPTIVCKQSIHTYSVNPITGATSYLWTVPNQAQIISGQGTNSISVMFGTKNGNITVKASNTCGTGTSSFLNIQVKKCSNSKNKISNNNELDIAIYPNPTLNEFNLIINSENEETFSLTIYDYSGKILENIKNVSPNYKFGSSLSKGIYLIQVRTRDKIVNKMIIKN